MKQIKCTICAGRRTQMAYKDSSDFRNEYPGGYAKGGDVYDGNNNHVGYVTGDGAYRITESGANQGQLYHNR